MCRAWHFFKGQSKGTHEYSPISFDALHNGGLKLIIIDAANCNCCEQGSQTQLLKLLSNAPGPISAICLLLCISNVALEDIKVRITLRHPRQTVHEAKHPRPPCLHGRSADLLKMTCGALVCVCVCVCARTPFALDNFVSNNRA